MAAAPRSVPPPMVPRCVGLAGRQRGMPLLFRGSPMISIGPGSFVDSTVKLADGVQIGRNCTITGSGTIGRNATLGNNVVIEGEFEVGANTCIGHHTVVVGTIQIGSENNFVSHCSVGQPPMDPDSPAPSGGIRIGDRNVFREFVTIHAPTIESLTVIGSDCYLMVYCHISHDCHVGNHVRMAHNATLAGNVVVDDYAFLGMHCVVHQRLHIGRNCMIGMNSTITKHVPPFALVFSGRFVKINRFGMKRNGFTEEEIRAIEAWYRQTSEEALAFPSKTALEEFFDTHHDGKIYLYGPPTV
jgi:UDP-N-acetylglucosamine acyltransferase